MEALRIILGKFHVSDLLVIITLIQGHKISKFLNLVKRKK